LSFLQLFQYFSEIDDPRTNGEVIVFLTKVIIGVNMANAIPITLDKFGGFISPPSKVCVAKVQGERIVGGDADHTGQENRGGDKRQVGVVTEIAPSCVGPQRRRLLDLGFVPGTVIRAELQGALSGAVAYRVRDTLIALRADQAEQIRIERGTAEVTAA